MSSRQDMSAAYDAAFNLPAKTPAKANDPKKAALDRAHEMRKFEIENYWKRATYFWSFQAIAFVVLGLVVSDGKLQGSMQILQLPAAIGAVSGLVGWLSAEGSKFWQENWESHVDMLEPEIEGRLTQTIWSDGRVSHSVSRLNRAFMATLTGAWVVVMAIPAFVALCPAMSNWIWQHSSYLLLGSLLLLLFIIWREARQNFSGFILRQEAWIEKDADRRWNWKKHGDAKEQRQLLLRHTKAKDAADPGQ